MASTVVRWLVIVIYNSFANTFHDKTLNYVIMLTFYFFRFETFKSFAEFSSRKNATSQVEPILSGSYSGRCLMWSLILLSLGKSDQISTNWPNSLLTTVEASYVISDDVFNQLFTQVPKNNNESYLMWSLLILLFS